MDVDSLTGQWAVVPAIIFSANFEAIHAASSALSSSAMAQCDGKQHMDGHIEEFRYT